MAASDTDESDDQDTRRETAVARLGGVLGSATDAAETLAATGSDLLDPEPQTRSLFSGTRDGIRQRLDYARSWSGRSSDTRSGTRTGSTSRPTAEHIQPARDRLSKFRQQYEDTPLLSAPINQFTDDLLADGWRITADDDRTQEFLTAWCEQCAIVAGAPGTDLVELLDVWNTSLEVYGSAPIENVPATERPDAVAALKMVPPATLSYHTRPGSAMLIQPEDYRRFTVEKASAENRNTAAAYTQYADDADHLWTDENGRELDPIHLDFEQITRAVRNPDAGGVEGQSAIATVSGDVERQKHYFEQDATAVESLAWGQYFAGFEPIVTDDGTIIEFDDGAQDEFEQAMRTMDPGGVLTHDGKINIENIPGEVADIMDRYQYQTDYILSAMPAPKFMAGFADDLNRDIASDQAEAHEQQVKLRKEKASRKFSPVLKRVAEQHGYPPDGVKLLLEAKPEKSPILSMSSEEIEQLGTYATALKELSGSADPATLVDERTLLTQILQLSEDDGVATDSVTAGGVDEQSDAVQRTFQNLTDAANSDGGDGGGGDGDGDGTLDGIGVATNGSGSESN